VAERRLGEDWEPPQNLAVFVGRSRSTKAVTTPLEVEHILALVRAIPDARWRFAFQLMAAYGLRPEELQHLQIRQGRLWCMYEKVASCGKTRPRVLRPLPCGRLGRRLATRGTIPNPGAASHAAWSRWWLHGALPDESTALEGATA
jgi:integrase